MREILFKAKRTDNGEWVEGSYVYTFVPDKQCPIVGIHKENYWIIKENGDICIIDPNTLCQYTGLTDKNGRKIWENDVVRSGGNLVVKWSEELASFYLGKEGWMYRHFFGEAVNGEECEVIGNIFDNVELLEGDAK